jgi:hypothetical protein
MKTLLRTLLHAAIGGFAAGLAVLPAGVPITTRTVLYPALASAASSVLSFLFPSPLQRFTGY